jgi:CheY-like chemotaxis protein
MYRELLKDVWLDGKVTDQEAQELSTMRDVFGITQEEHLKLEREIKIEAYLEALRIAWRDHSLSGLEQKALQMMLEKYDISQEEQVEAESRYTEIKRSSKSRGDVLIVDTNRETLVSLGKALTHRGFAVLMAQKPEDALKILSTHTPNFILSDVLFSKDQMDGVELLRKLNDLSILKKTKFFFISSVTDKKVIQACYRLGADQVLAKPVDLDTLLSMIEGRLHVFYPERASS